MENAGISAGLSKNPGGRLDFYTEGDFAAIPSCSVMALWGRDCSILQGYPACREGDCNGREKK